MSIQTDIKTLIFDWDGTLADSTAWIVDAVQFAFANADLPIPTAEEARQIIGLSLENAMLALNPNLSQAQQEKVIETKYSSKIFCPVVYISSHLI